MTTRVADIRRWSLEAAAGEVWFVEPHHHRDKAADAISVGVLSHFTHRFSTIALGPLSLYHRINGDPGCPGIADRVFVYDPLATDEGQLAPGLVLDSPLGTFERGIPLAELQLICVSLTNPDAICTALNLLWLGGVPPQRSERSPGRHPLLIVGGPGACNPEPFADFFDFVCVGDGAALTARLVKAIHATLAGGAQPSGDHIADRLGAVEGLYVPARYHFTYAETRVVQIDGPVARVPPATDSPYSATGASLVSDGDTAVIVPNHGCKHRCAYCSISEIDYRQLEIEPLLAHIDAYLAQGISTLIVNSATLTQHSDVVPLLQGLSERVERCGRPVRVYIGSVRFDELTASVLHQIGRLEGFSHTYLLYSRGSESKFMALAPEHGSRALMRRVRRSVDPWSILDAVDAAREYGVHHFVLYFIVGIESETAEDRDQISALIAAILDRIDAAGGRVIAKINPLIPTPGTACQRMPMPTATEYRTYLHQVEAGIVQRVGAERFSEQVHIVPLREERLALEAVINRADRRVGPLILRIAQARAEGREPSACQLRQWLEALGLSWAQLVGPRPADEPLPWQVVDATSPRTEHLVLSAVRP